MGGRVVAIVNWQPAAALKDNLRLLERANGEGRVRPREWRARAARFRSLVLREDGLLELQSFSTTATARRLGGVCAPGRTRKTGMGERG